MATFSAIVVSVYTEVAAWATLNSALVPNVIATVVASDAPELVSKPFVDTVDVIVVNAWKCLPVFCDA
jgi:hypothetical protein